jgi:apolipoprotein N-acyltransferase
VFGASVWELGDHAPRRYNAALLVRPDGGMDARYYKMHPVIFGEYVPFGDTFPSLYHLFPLPNGLTPGVQPVAWDLGGLTLSPSICFENTMPHLLRWHVTALTRAGRAPDVLINLTNDGWFWGSSILDMQRDCAVLRAVELRRPFLVAANTGLSAWIDGNGLVRAQGPRRACRHLLAEVVPDGRTSLYVIWGDGPALLCTLWVVLAGASGFWRRWAGKRTGPDRAADVSGRAEPA